MGNIFRLHNFLVDGFVEIDLKEVSTMRGKPLLPFAIIAAAGILLMVSYSLYGQGLRAEMNADDADLDEEVVEFDDPVAAGEELAEQSCIGCHGGDLTGASGPDITGLEGTYSDEEIADIIINGVGGMPPIDVNEVEADAIAQYVLTLE